MANSKNPDLNDVVEGAKKALESVTAILGGLAILLGLFALTFFVVLPAAGFDGTARIAHSFFQILFPILVALVVALILVALASRDSRAMKALGGVVGLSIAGGILSGLGVGSDAGIGNVWSAMNSSGHDRRVEYVVDLTEVNEQRPDYGERIARSQADFVIRRSLAGVVGEVSPEPIRVADEWCAYITTAAELRNRWVESVVCVNDAGRVRRASFPLDTVPAVGLGFRRSEMTNIVAEVAGSDALMRDDDVYGYITEVDGEEVPRLVVPLADRRGLDLSKPLMPDGAVIFGVNDDGDYAVQVLDEVKAGEHPGPVVGLAAAERVRESVNDSYGFLVSKKPSRSALSLQGTITSEGEDEDGNPIFDTSDPNIGNSTEFVLERDGVPYAVTPLTSFGSASTITAYLEVRLDTITNGEPLEATLYRLPEPEAANTTLANTIRVLYGQDLAEADRIYEVTPSAAGTSRITIGREDQVRFVARSETEIVSGELVGEICVESRTGAALNCSPLNADPRPLGTLVFDNSTRSTTTTGDSGDATSLQDVPLEDLLAEIERRVNEG